MAYPAYDSNRASPVNVLYPNGRPNPNGQSYPPFASDDSSRDSLASIDDASTNTYKNQKNGEVIVDMRELSRTPSPTPSEAKELEKSGVFDLKAMMNWRFWIRKEWAWYYIAFIVALVVVILFTVYHDTIVRWLQPAATWMHNLKLGWLIPIAVFFVISFPPLFGHEIVAIVCGLVWGLWIGFAIVAAGTFLGELGNFYAFKHCCTARGEKLERTKISYACLAKVVREGGFKIALIARFSAIPGHFTTAVFATCGMHVLTFMLAAALSLPKQFITVYLGVAMEQSETGGGSKNDTIVKDAVVGISVVITFVAMWYIYHLMNKVKSEVIHERRKARQAKMMAAIGEAPYNNPTMLQSSTSVAFNPNTSESEIPLNPQVHQQWDENGRAVGYAGDPNLYVPKPVRAQPRQPAFATTFRPQQQQQQQRADSLGSTYQMSERTPYQPVRHGTDTSQSPTMNAQPHVSGTEPALPNPFGDSVRPPSRPMYTASPPPIVPFAPASSSRPHTPQTAPGAFNSFATPTQAQFSLGSAPASAPLPFHTPAPASPSYAPPPGPPPQQHPTNPFAAYDSTTSVQSEAGSLPPSYSESGYR